MFNLIDELVEEATKNMVNFRQGLAMSLLEENVKDLSRLNLERKKRQEEQEALKAAREIQLGSLMIEYCDRVMNTK